MQALSLQDAVPALDWKSGQWDFCLPPSSAREEDPDVPCRWQEGCAGADKDLRARSHLVSLVDDALCLPASVSGGETVVSCMKPVRSWAGREQNGSGHFTLSIALGMTAGHWSSSRRQKVQQDQATLGSSGPTKPTWEDSPPESILPFKTSFE